MDQTTPLSGQFGNLHLSRAEAILYLLLYYVFGYIHPNYQDYIDAVAIQYRLELIEQRTAHVQDFWWGKTDQLDTAQFKVTIPDLNAREWLNLIFVIMHKTVGWIEQSEIHKPDAHIRAPP